MSWRFRAFELRVVKWLRSSNAQTRVAVAQQPFANVRTDETRAAGDQKIHGEKLATSARDVECQAFGLLPELAAIAFEQAVKGA